MLSLLVAAALTKIAYAFPEGVVRTYDVQVVFEGYIPILGGQEGKVQVDLAVDAKGLKLADGNQQVKSELKELSIIFNGAALPLNAKSAQTYFPPTTISLSPWGSTLKTDAPDISLPVKLPGLDIKRFPDITYLPIEFPEAGIEAGKSWTVKKSFGGSDVVYVLTPKTITDDAVNLDISLTQTYEVFEDEGKEVVQDAKDAITKVKTDLKGKGTATFDRKLNLVNKLDVAADANSVVTDLQTKATSDRKLKTTMSISLHKKP